MKVAVLGCGPAGLFAAAGAAAACSDSGIMEESEFSILSRKRKSELFGAQFLHKPIPGVTLDMNKTSVEYRLIGDSADYRRKVYGQMWAGSVSPEDLEGLHEAWDIRATYDICWQVFDGAINDVEIDPIGLSDMIDDAGFDLIFSSIPLNRLCVRSHTFGEAGIIAAGDAPARGIDVGKMFHCIDDTVICNGNESPAWYRMSRIFGHTTVEWPQSVSQVPVSTATYVGKPTYNNCDCWPQIQRVGRFGTWTKGVLSHEAYFDAYNITENKIN